jgi:hypothetical protein
MHIMPYGVWVGAPRHVVAGIGYTSLHMVLCSSGTICSYAITLVLQIVLGMVGDTYMDQYLVVYTYP